MSPEAQVPASSDARKSHEVPGFLERILRFSAHRPGAILLGAAAVVLFGCYGYLHLSVDAVPDVTDVQVQINTEVPGYSPLEAERRVTFPVETALGGTPRLRRTRSVSRYGLSQVTAVFEDGTDVYFARQLVNEKLQSVRGLLPAGAEPRPGPVTTGLGEIFMFTVEALPGARNGEGDLFTPADLRGVADWTVRPRLRTVPGVVELNIIGGHEKQFVVAPDPEKLVAYDLTLEEVGHAVESNNGTVGAGFVERSGEQRLVRVPAELATAGEIGAVPLRSEGAAVVRVRDVASVGTGHGLRDGAATRNGGEVVLCSVHMLVGGNSREVARLVGERLKEIDRSLPPGVVTRTVYDRTRLVESVVRTTARNLLEGAALVVAILFLFLGDIRAATVAALVIPLTMLVTLGVMSAAGVTANLMSLGALDFGMIVDGAVIVVENCVRRFGEAARVVGRPLTSGERADLTFEAAKEVRSATLVGELIIMIVYLPILTLRGVEGRMFVPTAAGTYARRGGACPSDSGRSTRGSCRRRSPAGASSSARRFSPRRPASS